MNEAGSSGPMIDRDSAAALMEPLTDLVVRAGAAILAVNRLAMKIDGKLDGSPVTEADLASDRIIAEGLARLIPNVPALSEEGAHQAKPPYHGSFFLIDPLDGTKEFVAGRNEFTVNLALVTNGTPLLGIIGAPALGLIWRGLVGRGAERLTTTDASARVAEPIHTRARPKRGEPWIVAVSRSHGDSRTEAFIEARPGAIPAPPVSEAGPGSWPSAVRTGTAGPKPSLRPDPAQSGRCWDRRSNSAGWRRAEPISIFAPPHSAEGR